ncbi:MAG: hypothetical protein JJW01_03540 [Alphaproteobacteria bacterium]|nr:hypothetical protein [Rickettsiales bacterium]
MKHFFYNEIPTTLDEVFNIFTKNRPNNEPVLVTSLRMTKGRGRVGKCWHANKDGNLHMSLAFNHLSFPILTSLPIVTVTSVGNMLNLPNIKGFCYKWPNDLFVDNKKFGGVLIEIKDNVFIIGVSVNIHYTPIVNNAEVTSLASKNCLNILGNNILSLDLGKQMFYISELIASDILSNLEKISGNNTNAATDAILTHANLWRKNCWKRIGDKITIKLSAVKSKEYIFKGICDDCLILVEELDEAGNGNGNIVSLSYGDVS